MGGAGQKSSSHRMVEPGDRYRLCTPLKAGVWLRAPVTTKAWVGWTEPPGSPKGASVQSGVVQGGHALVGGQSKEHFPQDVGAR